VAKNNKADDQKTNKIKRPKESEDSSKLDDSRAATLARLEAQKILAIQANQTKAAALIQKIIDLISKR
jgi:hypothetical protein